MTQIQASTIKRQWTKKLEILNTIRENKIDLNELLDEYKEFYTEENKIHVVDVADEGLEILLKEETK
ncbi:hypothetical protein [Algoriphagus boritolerans]|uniref:hypothetical protein n=1 Tax=Algoriphagus boritolerans TaxID=308111 RepID=UPI002FCE4EB2